jgi:hypothetical protein
MAKSTDPRLPVDNNIVEVALDNALAAHVAKLFDNLCAGMREEAEDPAAGRRTPGTLALDRFAQGYHIAVSAHRAVLDKLDADAEQAEREADERAEREKNESDQRAEAESEKRKEPATA